jgi:hypothetical protein
MIFYFKHIYIFTKSSLAVLTLLLSFIEAETGKGKDIFEVVMTIFGVDKSKGDLVYPDFI